MSTILWALVPHTDTYAVRKTLEFLHQPFTTQKARGGHYADKHTIFWIIAADQEIPQISQAIHNASPPRTIPYHSHHGWHADSWLHPTTIDIQGAILAQWPNSLGITNMVVPC